MGYKWPENVEEKSLFVDAEGKVLKFADQTEVEVDAIILCTGYKHHFPFLESSLKLDCKNLLWINSLKQGVVSPANDRLYFMSMTNHFLTWEHFAAQAWFVRDCLLGRYDSSVPLKDESGKTFTNDDFQSLMENIRSTLDAFRMQAKYVECLMVATGYCKEVVQPFAYTQAVADNLNQLVADKRENILTFRDKSFKSLVTGNQAPLPAPGKTWLNAKDDESLDFYLSQHK